MEQAIILLQKYLDFNSFENKKYQLFPFDYFMEKFPSHNMALHRCSCFTWCRHVPFKPAIPLRYSGSLISLAHSSFAPSCFGQSVGFRLSFRSSPKIIFLALRLLHKFSTLHCGPSAHQNWLLLKYWHLVSGSFIPYQYAWYSFLLALFWVKPIPILL